MHDLSPEPAGRPDTPEKKPAGVDLGPARSVDPALRLAAERSYGAGLGDVTVHTGADAAGFARRQGGVAATVGTRIAFADGSYRPGTLRGDAVLAHELAHVVQQRGTTATGEVDLPSGPAAEEHGADRAAAGLLLRSRGHEAAADALGAAVRPRTTAGPPRVQACVSCTEPARMSDVTVDTGITAEQQELMDSLEGLETPYEAIQEWRKVRDAAGTAVALGGDLGVAVLGSSAQETFYEQAEAAAKVEDTSVMEVSQKAAGFAQLFEDHAVNLAYSILQTNEELIQGEADRYAGDPATGGTADLAAALAPHQAALRQAAADQKYAAGTTTNYGGGRGVTITKTPPDAAQKLAGAAAVEDRVRTALVARFPVLADPQVRAGDLTTSPAELQTALLRVTSNRLDDVRKTRGALKDDHSRIWDFDNAVAAARRSLQIPDGSVFDLIIKDRIAERQREELFTNLLVGALAIGLGLLSFGGGTVAVLGAVGGAALSTGSAYVHVQKYLRESAAAGSALDRAKALSSQEPSWFWLAVDIAAAILDLGMAAKVFAELKSGATAVQVGTKTVETFKAEAVTFAKSEPELAADAEKIGAVAEHAIEKQLSRREVIAAAKKAEPGAVKSLSAVVATDEATSGLLRVEAASRAKLLTAFAKRPEVLARLGTLLDEAPETAGLIKLMSEGLSDPQFTAVIGKYMITRSEGAPNILRAMAQVGLDADDIKIIAAGLGKSRSTVQIGRRFATGAIDRIAQRLPAGAEGIKKYRAIAAGLHPNQSGIIFEKWATKNVYKAPVAERFGAEKAVLERQFADRKPAFKGTKAEIESDHTLHEAGEATLVDCKSSQTGHAFSEEELAQLHNYAELIRIKAASRGGDTFTKVEYLFGTRAGAEKNGPAVLAKLGDRAAVFFLDDAGAKVRYIGALP
ncbi:DUF4157 domain-containing protein [Actinoplanes sp. M2I2]|uniref:eCIS core domain-containing protein n=1 Tax=Actinoplanes sp. M2I2 TaxID=1734444 RepID=UPI0020205284|nr:DUF4157 domain-containing protein [Actinoplanes sp. M2I2]